MDREDVSLALQALSVAISAWLLWRGRQGKPRPGRHRRKR